MRPSEGVGASTVLSVENICCVRGGRTLFSGLSFVVAPGESLLLRGPNGIGKSSLLRMIAGLLPCASGRIDLNGAIALADEHPALDPDRRLRDALSLWARMDGATAAQIDEALARFSLDRLAEIPVRMLSTGQRKRAALARTMASGARLWLLDEPGNGLDTASLEALGAAMDRHLTEGGAIVAASHFGLPHGFTRIVDVAEFAR